ncbi:MAG: DUF4350 domain-containing protein [Pirellula sp.]
MFPVPRLSLSSIASTRCPGGNLMTACFVPVLFLCIVLGAASVSFAQTPPMRPTDAEWYFRYELFQLLLEKRGMRVSKFVNDAVLKPEESVVVLLGDLQKISQSTWSNLRSFVARGGNLLIATDRTPRTLGLGIMDIGVVNAGPVLAQLARDQYSGFSDCVRVRELDQEHPITNGLTEIVTNRSGWIDKPISTRGDSRRWQSIAALPNKGIPIESRGSPLIAVYKDPFQNSGSAVLVSDASLFTNSMLWHADNALLSIRMADWLCENNRKTLVYLVDGSALPSYAESVAKAQNAESKANARPPSSSTRPTPNAATLLQIANHVLKRVAESNIVNETIRNQPRNLSIGTYFRWVWGAFAAILIGMLILYFLRRSPTLSAFLNTRKMRSWHEIQSGAQHTLDQNSFAAECLARDFCRNWTLKDTPAEWKQYLQDFDLDAGTIPITQKEKTSVKNIVELAVYGKKAHFTDEHLLSLGTTIRALLLKLPAKSTDTQLV